MMKVYLSKSNCGNPDDLMIVREALKNYNVEVVEYNGGAYSKKPLMECAIMFVLPPDKENQTVGKGQYTEIDTFNGLIFVYSHCTYSNEPIFAYVSGTTITDNNWQTDYAKYETGTRHKLSGLLEGRDAATIMSPREDQTHEEDYEKESDTLHYEINTKELVKPLLLIKRK